MLRLAKQVPKWHTLVCAYFLFSSPQAFCVTETPAPQPLLVHVQVESKSEPKESTGIVLSTSGSYEISQTTRTKIGEKIYQVSFSVPADKIKSDSVATAMIVAEDGSVAFSNVTPALALDRSRSLQLLDIKDCAPEEAKGFANAASIGPLRQLVDIRSARSELAKMKLSRLLAEPLLTKLRKFEDVFGLNYEQPLSADIAPEELVDRIARLSYAVNDFKTARGTATSSK